MSPFGSSKHDCPNYVPVNLSSQHATKFNKQDIAPKKCYQIGVDVCNHINVNEIHPHTKNFKH